jgi:predicted membrane protein
MEAVMDPERMTDDSTASGEGPSHVPPGRNAPRLFIGLVILTIGALALLDSLGVVEIGDAWRFWPLFFVAIGLARILRPRGSPGRFTGLVFFVIGLVLLLRELDLMFFPPRILWPTILLLIGGRLVWGAWWHGGRNAPPADPSGRMSSLSLFGGAEHRSNSADYRGGDATAVFGSCKIDLRQAAIMSGEAVIDAFAMWGSVEIWVPRDWGVSLQGTPILGSFEDKTNQVKEAAGPRLVVRGAAIMGSVEVKS